MTASMTMPQFRSEEAIPGGIKLSPVRVTGVPYSGCFATECALPLETLENRAVDIQKERLVYPAWAPDPTRAKNDPGSSSGLSDPSWTHCGGSQ
jgi:hypothetical protein